MTKLGGKLLTNADAVHLLISEKLHPSDEPEDDERDEERYSQRPRDGCHMDNAEDPHGDGEPLEPHGSRRRPEEDHRSHVSHN